MERENNMFGIRELKERVAKLEEELGKSQKAISFLLEHDKSEIVFKRVHSFLDDNIEIYYIYKGEFKVAKIFNWCTMPTMEKTEDIDGSTTIIHIAENYLNEKGVVKVDKYYQLDKVANTLTDITETRKALLKETEKKTTTTKSQNKKENK